MKRSKQGSLTKKEFESLSEFRFQIRRFERFSENAVKKFGVTPLQYLLMLHIKGYPGRVHASVGELADRLQASPHGVVALISRCEALGLVERRQNENDRRQVDVYLLEKGEALLTQLATLHRSELRSMQETFPIPSINA
jgi:DNA-binding MarR family transcriptional regulator